MRAVKAIASALTLAVGVDTLATLTPLSIEPLVAARVMFRAGYIDHVTPAELAAQLSLGIAFSPVTYALETDGAHTVARLAALGIPKGVTVWLDVERVSAPLDKATLTASINAWARAVTLAGYEPGLYVGAGCPLSSAELYALLVVRYWRSASDVPNVAVRGYCMTQLRPLQVYVAGASVFVDVDVVEPDFKGDVPTFVTA